MEDFGENLRGSRGFTICPFLCSQRYSQILSFQCIGISQKIELDENYNAIFKSDIPVKTIYTLTKIRKLRNSFLEDENISIFSNERQTQKRKLNS